MNLRPIYRALRAFGDVRAARAGRLPQRLARRLYYRAVLTAARRIERRVKRRGRRTR